MFPCSAYIQSVELGRPVHSDTNSADLGGTQPLHSIVNSFIIIKTFLIQQPGMSHGGLETRQIDHTFDQFVD